MYPLEFRVACCLLPTAYCLLPMPISRLHKILMLALMLMMMGCQGQSTPSRQYFDTAEEAYKSGRYEVAHQNYSLFLRLNPDPQLARLAERRILSIERELESVLGQKNGPRPAYVNQDETSEVPSQYPTILHKIDSSMRMQ